MQLQILVAVIAIQHVVAKRKSTLLWVLDQVVKNF